MAKAAARTRGESEHVGLGCRRGEVSGGIGGHARLYGGRMVEGGGAAWCSADGRSAERVQTRLKRCNSAESARANAASVMQMQLLLAI